MKKSLVKIISLVATAALTVSAAGCMKTGSNNGKFKRNDKGFPEEIHIFGYETGGYSIKTPEGNPNGILGWKLLENRTGTHVNWSGDLYSAEKFNLMITSGNLADVIAYNWSDVPGGPKAYSDDGVILPLKDLIAKHMPNLSAFLKQRPEIAKEFTYDNGEIYYIPMMRTEQVIYYGPQIRKDWLDQLGLEIPRTTDDLYNVLKSFKTLGNDIIPMGAYLGGVGLMAGAFGTTNDLYVDNGKIKYGIMEDRFEEYLKYVQKLYSEGLIDRDFLINDRGKVDSKMINNKMGFVNSYQPSNYQNSMDDGKRRVVAIPYITGPYGDRKYYFSEQATFTYPTASIAITTACKDPEGVLKWLDEIYGEQGHIYMNFGEEGKTFNWVDGFPKFTDYILNNPDGTPAAEMLGTNIAVMEAAFPFFNDIRTYKQTLKPWGVEALETWTASADFSGIIPRGVFFTEEEMEVNTQIMAQVKTFAEESEYRIIVGTEKIENLPAIRNRVKQLGIDTVIENYQKAYERYLSK